MSWNKLKVLLFDLGGTLMFGKDPWPPLFERAEAALRRSLTAAGVSFNTGVYGGCQSFLEFYNQRRDDRSDLTEEVSADLLKDLLAKNGFPDVGDETVAAALKAMYAITQENWIPESDALPALQALTGAGYRIGLISNAADDENTHILIDKGGFRPFAEFIISSAGCGIRKPHPRIFQLALDHFRVQPSAAAMIGDALEADVLGANRVGIFSIWITRRAQPVETDIGRILPNARIDSLQELPALLESLA